MISGIFSHFSWLQKSLREVQQILNSTEGNFHQLVALLNCRGLNKVIIDAVHTVECGNEWKRANYQQAASILGLYWLPERPVLWWDGGIALPVSVLFPLGSGLHCHPLFSAWCLEELPQVRHCVFMRLCPGVFALHHHLVEMRRSRTLYVDDLFG